MHFAELMPQDADARVIIRLLFQPTRRADFHTLLHLLLRPRHTYGEHCKRPQIAPSSTYYLHLTPHMPNYAGNMMSAISMRQALKIL